jgi:hypothetical protein
MCWGTVCASAAVILPNDLVRGVGFGTGDQLELYRPVGTPPLGPVADPWPSDTASFESVEFDNLGGIPHNAQGNLLAMPFGTTTSGGSLYSLATNGSPTVTKLTDINSTTWPALTTTRVDGISANPSNSRVALTGGDSTRVIVFDYEPGDGSGNGSVSNPRQTPSGMFGLGAPSGTAWKDDNTVLFFNTDGAGNGRLAVADANNMSAGLSYVASAPIGVPTAATDVEYDPLISPYVYVSVGRFNGVTSTNRILVFDPRNHYMLVKNLDLSPSPTLPDDTFREIALDLNGNLYISMFTSGASGAAVARLNDVVSNPAGLTSANLISDFYTTNVTGAFSMIDVALPEPQMCVLLGGMLLISNRQRRRGGKS